MNFKTFTVIILSMLVVTGCVSVKYSGKHYAPTKDVKFFLKKSDIKKPYTIMGKAVASASEHFTTKHVENALISKAEAEGADAVLFVNFAKVKSGEVREDQILNEEAAESWPIDDDSASDWNNLVGSFDNMPAKNDPEEATYKIVIKALFLKYKK